MEIGYEVQFLRDMLKIYSPSGREADLGNFLFEQMKEFGYTVSMDEVGNVIGEIGKGVPTILFCGHLDTVPGRMPVDIKEGRIYGRGAVDCKGPFAAMILAASRYIQSGGEGRVLTVGFVEEEKYGKGAKHFVRKPAFVDYIISAEASGIDGVTIGYKGLLNLIISIHTTTGHSSAPKGEHINSIEAAYNLWKSIEEYTESRTANGRQAQFRSLTSVLTHMNGGVHEGFTRVPGKCKFEVNIRIPSKYTPEMIWKEIENLINDFERENPKAKVEWELVEEENPFKISATTPFVKTVRDAVREVRGRPPSLRVHTATGDINVLYSEWRIPALSYGPGDSHLGHSPVEYLEIEEYLNSIPVYEKILAKLVELHRFENFAGSYVVEIRRNELNESLEGKFLRKTLGEKGLASTQIDEIEQRLLAFIEKETEKRGLSLSNEVRRSLANVMVLVAKRIDEEI